MKHFHAGRHMIAAKTMPAVAVSLLLASACVSLAIAQVIEQSHSNDFDSDGYVKPMNEAIDHLNTVRADIKDIIGRFDTEDAGAVEAKDIDHVIVDLVDNGYLASTSPVIDLLKTQDLAKTFAELDKLVEDTIISLMVTRDNMSVDSTDDYLSFTKPLLSTNSELSIFGQDLHTVIAATWRDHNNLSSFAPGTDNSLKTVSDKKSVAA
jgi:hypothetical protein